MEKRSSTFLLIPFLLVSWSFFAATKAEKNPYSRTDALNDFFEAKLFTNDDYHTTIDTSLLVVNKEDGANDARFRILAQQGRSREGDRIERLPGKPSVQFDQYGGYVTIDEEAGRAFYYYFVEAEKTKHSKPLLLWLIGGHSCSPLASGERTKLGPFRVHGDGLTFYRNQYAWNNAANVLFLESQVGVSFNGTTSRKTAEDNYIFLLNWMERFPEYKDRHFYISGESYAELYIPKLAHIILLHNKKANKTIINLKGIIIKDHLFTLTEF